MFRGFESLLVIFQIKQGNTMKDFLGNTYVVGDFVAASGKGNTACEYGMILYKVLKITDKLQLQRLTADYKRTGDGHEAKDYEIVVGSRKSTVSKPQAYIICQPSQKIVDLFERVVEKNTRPEDLEKVADWIHGKQVW